MFSKLFVKLFFASYKWPEFFGKGARSIAKTFHSGLALKEADIDKNAALANRLKASMPDLYKNAPNLKVLFKDASGFDLTAPLSIAINRLGKYMSVEDIEIFVQMTYTIGRDNGPMMSVAQLTDYVTAIYEIDYIAKEAQDQNLSQRDVVKHLVMTLGARIRIREPRINLDSVVLAMGLKA